jgi:hypothetical protein
MISLLFIGPSADSARSLEAPGASHCLLITAFGEFCFANVIPAVSKTQTEFGIKHISNRQLWNRAGQTESKLLARS